MYVVQAIQYQLAIDDRINREIIMKITIISIAVNESVYLTRNRFDFTILPITIQWKRKEFKFNCGGESERKEGANFDFN